LTIPWADLKATFATLLRSTRLGFIAGILPGGGGSLGSFMASTAERSWVGSSGRFGKGEPGGVAAPEAGNTAAAGGAAIPILPLAVRGAGTPPVMRALLTTVDIPPHPLRFTEQPEVVWGLIARLLSANGVL